MLNLPLKLKTSKISVRIEQGNLLDALVQEGIVIISGIVGIGFAVITTWMRKRGIPVII